MTRKNATITELQQGNVVKPINSYLAQKNKLNCILYNQFESSVTVFTTCGAIKSALQFSATPPIIILKLINQLLSQFNADKPENVVTLNHHKYINLTT